MHCNPLIRKACNIFSRWIRLILPLLILGIHPGCTPLSETEKEYLEQRDANRELEEKFNAGLSENDRQQEVLAKAKAHPVEGVGTSEQWVTAKMDEENEQIAFQNWIVRQKSEHIFEVRFLYTTLDTSFQIKKKGYSWTVNKLLDYKVTGPIEMDEAELVPSYRRKGEVKTERDRSEERWTLE